MSTGRDVGVNGRCAGRRLDLNTKVSQDLRMLSFC